MTIAIPAHAELRRRRPTYVRHALIASLLIHGLVFVLSPELNIKPYRLKEPDRPPTVVESVPDVEIPKPPKDVEPPEIEFDGSEDPEDGIDQYPTTTPFDFAEMSEGMDSRVMTVDQVVLFDELPVPIHFEVPEYPKLAREAGFEGEVRIEVLISEYGEVLEAKVVSSDVSAAMERAAVRAAMKCRFTPAKQRTTPVRARVVIPFDFRLH